MDGVGDEAVEEAEENRRLLARPPLACLILQSKLQIVQKNMTTRKRKKI